MKPVKFSIEKLGAIRDSEVHLSPLMIFSGESGLGKSYVSFLVHYLYILLSQDRLTGFFEVKGYNFDEIINKRKENKEGILLNIKVEDLQNWINKDAIRYIGYLLGFSSFSGCVRIEIPIEKKDLSFRYREEMFGLNNKEDVFYEIILGSIVYRVPSSNEGQFGVEPFVVLLKAYLSILIFEDIHFLRLRKTFLMPTSRGSLIELGTRPKFSSGMYEEFFDNKEELERPIKDPSPYKIPESLSKCLFEINTGSIQRKEGKIFYYINGEIIPITAAASSIKELVPLTMFLQKYNADGSSILFEEPEAHLHPDRQVKVADLIGCAVGLGCHMQITTHSDYFLKRINNLMQLFQLKKKNIKGFDEICGKFDINKESIIDPRNVKAYVLEKREEDSSTKIVAQNLEEGIPFTSFYKVIDEDILGSREIQKALEE